MDLFSKTTGGPFPRKHHRCISLESGQTSTTKKTYPKTPVDAAPRFFPRRYSTPELAMRKHALKRRGEDGDGRQQPILNKSCQTDILGLDKYLERSRRPPGAADDLADSAETLRTYKRPSKKTKVRSVAVHCERRRLTFAAFKGCQKFKHVYKRKVSLPPPPQQHPSPSPSSSTTTARSTSADGCRRDGGGVLPKLRPDRRTAETERPAANRAKPAIKLPRIPGAGDVKPDCCWLDDGGGATRLAALTRPRSTGSGSGTGGSDVDRKLAYFRASSAPKVVDSPRYCTLVGTSKPPPRERERQSTTPGSSDTADTALDMSSVQRQTTTADDAAKTTTTTTSSTATRTVSTSTAFSQPVFPIVFSCESVLRHPLDGGYVSHTESHRFSVHYAPVDDVGAAAVATADDGSSSSLVFTSDNACRDERCPSGDGFTSFTVDAASKPDDSAEPSSASTPDATQPERRLIVERLNAGAQFENATCGTVADGKDWRPGKTVENHDGNDVVRIQDGFYVLGKGDINVNAFEKAAGAVSTSADRIVDTTGEDGVKGEKEEKEEEGVVVLESRCTRTEDMLLQRDERNYERLTQTCQVDRTVSNQSPKLDGAATQLGAVGQSQTDWKPCEHDETRATESDNFVPSPTNDGPPRITDNSNYLNVPSDRRDENMASQHVRRQPRRGDERTGKGIEHDFGNKRNVPPNRLYDDVSRKRDGGGADRDPPYRTSTRLGATTVTEKPDARNQRRGDPFGKRAANGSATDRGKCDACWPDAVDCRHEYYRHGTVCLGCADGVSRRRNGQPRTGDRTADKNRHRRGGAKPDDRNANRGPDAYDDGNSRHPVSKRRLESVDECAESSNNSYVGGGFLFGDGFYAKRPQADHDAADGRDGGRSCAYEWCDDGAKTANSSPKPEAGRQHRYGYYHDYAAKTRRGQLDEDCTVFAGHCDDDAPQRTSHYSQTDGGAACDADDCDGNTDSDDSLTDSLEDGCKYEGAAVSYFLALDGRKSAAVTFTLKMPNTLESRLNRRHSLLKKHLHVSTAAQKTPPARRVRARHKGCQTLWTEEKGVQVQRGFAAGAATRRKPVDDHNVLQTLLTGLERNRVSANQIRLVGGQKMVSEGNQTEPAPDRHGQLTRATRDAAVGPATPENNAAARDSHGGQSLLQQHAAKKFSSDNALMVGVVRQNKYKGKEALDGAKNDQLLTLSKGWINFYTLRADSVDTDAQESHDNDDEIRPDDDSQRYTVHVQAIPEPVALPAVHVSNRNALQLPKTCAATKHLPRLVQTDTNSRRCQSHLATANGWCVSVDGPNNMHMKVSLLPDRSDVKTTERFDLNNEENKLEARRLTVQRKNNCGARRPYRNIKRTQSTPRDMFSADASRTESALSAESKYIETIDTQLLIHKARRRLSQEWDTRIQNGGVTESVQLVVTGDSVSSKTSQHYTATRGHQHCSFRRQSRRI